MHTFYTHKLPEELEAWMQNPAPMRSRNTATVHCSLVARGVTCISIRHQELQGVDSAMVYWWFKYFCYQNLVTANGTPVSAFVLWHPRDHVNFEIEKHSLSGEIGVCKGAVVSIVKSHGRRLLSSGEARVVDLSNNRFSIKYQNCLHQKVLITDDFVDTKSGLLLISNIVKVANRFAQQSENCFICDADSKNWIEHKIEEIGNLQIILPILVEAIPSQ